MKQLTIDPMFRDALPKLTEKEFQQLEENILADGEIREPLIVWRNTIIDGHNRYEIAQKHDMPFKIKTMEFADQWAAIDWMCRNQLGKRNLTENQKAYTLGKLYEARKNTDSFKGNQFTKNAGGGGENGHDHNRHSKTRDEIAKEQGTTPYHVKSAYEFSRSVDEAENDIPGFRDKVLRGNGGRMAIQSMNRMNDEERKEAAEAIMRGDYVKVKKPVAVKAEETADPYNADDFRLEIGQFPRNLKTSIQMTLNIHGDMLAKEECRKDFSAMLDDVIAVANKFKGEMKNG